MVKSVEQDNTIALNLKQLKKFNYPAGKYLLKVIKKNISLIC